MDVLVVMCMDAHWGSIMTFNKTRIISKIKKCVFPISIHLYRLGITIFFIISCTGLNGQFLDQMQLLF